MLAPASIAAWARQRALAARLLLGAVARYVAAWARLSPASGSPIRSTASAAAVATRSAWGSALPTSSEARITIRRAMKRGSSPAASILAR